MPARQAWTMPSESHKTVYLALAANAGIGVAKLAGGLISGSSAMLAEAAHSAADTTNQLLLLASLNLAERPPVPEITEVFRDPTRRAKHD